VRQTPKLPLRIADEGSHLGDHELYILDAEDKLFSYQSSGVPQDAAFVVRVCNVHDELLEACEKALERLDYGGEQELCDKLLSVVQKARGEEI